ncbi:hypothetical protein [Marinobacter sp. ELB17]|uniref:hypothetical protein n=1 Tax=Marinobacter sp. ELB17 TaxID=270374 RepID=UPI0018DCF0E0|nr:hypothetical protein [Marinobacter sp. ELB17]
MILEKLSIFSDRQPDTSKRTGLNAQYTETKHQYPTLNVEIAPILKPAQSPQWSKKSPYSSPGTNSPPFVAYCLGVGNRHQVPNTVTLKTKAFPSMTMAQTALSTPVKN